MQKIFGNFLLWIQGGDDKSTWKWKHCWKILNFTSECRGFKGILNFWDTYKDKFMLFLFWGMITFVNALFLLRYFFSEQNTSSLWGIRPNQFNLLVYGQDNIKNTVGRQNGIFCAQFLGSTFWKEKYFFLSKQSRGTSNCFSTVYLFIVPS